MAQALIRKLKDETLADYRSAAAAKGRSLEAELRELIESNRPPRKKDSTALLALSERLRANTPASAARVDSTEYIRWARDTDAGRYLGGGADDDDAGC
jgi:plasmid stability protein